MAPLLPILYMLDKCACLFCRADFLNEFIKNSNRNAIRVSTVWIQIRPDIMSGQIWVQTVYKDNRSVTIAGKELIINPNFERVTEI